jgi:hypothetical protein
MKDLEYLISEDHGDDSEAEKVRDKMDPLWFQLSEIEREEINKDIRLPNEFFAQKGMG